MRPILKYAQGGVAVVNDLENDSFAKHIEDTLIAGDGLCDPHIVEIVVKEGPASVEEIIDWGASLTRIRKAISSWEKKAAIPRTGSCTTKT
jgi:aspartate oxidase